MCIARTSKAAARLSASFRDRDSVEKTYYAVVTGELSGSGTREDLLVPVFSSVNGAKGVRGPRMTVVRESVAAGAAEEGGSRSAGRAEAGTKGSQRAVLEWEAIHNLTSANAKLCHPTGGGADRPHTLVRIKLITGRKHQIRAQLAGMGHPIVGDVRYGGRSSVSYRGESRGSRNGKDRVEVMEEFETGSSGLSPLKDKSILLHASELAVPHPTRPGEAVRMRAPPPDCWAELCGDDVFRFVSSNSMQKLVKTRKIVKD